MDEDEYGNSYLLDCPELPTTNHSTIVAFVKDSLKLLWPDGVKYENVLLAILNAPLYMVKWFILNFLFPSLYRVAEFIRSKYLDETFKKSPARKHIFLELADGVVFPSEPVVTRWGS